MYRVFLYLAFLAYCSAISFSDSNLRQFLRNDELDSTDLVDHTGGGYEFFKKQQIDARPLIQSPAITAPPDLAGYFQSSAFKQQPIQTQIFTGSNNPLRNNIFGQQQLTPRLNFAMKNLLPKPIQSQQPNFLQNDLSQLSSSIQQANFPLQNNFLNRNLFGNQQQQDLQTIDSEQILLPPTNLNIQQRMLNNYGNQQRDLAFIQQQQDLSYVQQPQQQDLSYLQQPQQQDLWYFQQHQQPDLSYLQQQDFPFTQQPQQTWNTQQNSLGFSSSFGGQGQQPVSSGFFIQSNQQNDRPFTTNAGFMSSQVPNQRFILRS